MSERPAPAARWGSESVIPYASHDVAEADVGAVSRALRSKHLVKGPLTRDFEASLAREIGVSDVVAVSSGTAALHVALAALGVGPGDEVIVPTLSFVATASAVRLCGATPVFADVQADTLNLDPWDVAPRITSRTKGAIPMHFAGHPAEMATLRSVLGPGRFVLEDACHALGASLLGRPAGSLGDAACFSFHPAKLVTTGEGGAVATGNAEVAARARRLREHGIERDPDRFLGLGLPEELRAEERGSWMYEVHETAPNYRLSEPAAALGKSQLADVAARVDRRREIAAHYGSELADVDALELPSERAGARSAWHLYPVRLHLDRIRGGRAAFFERLRGRGIGVQVHYIPIHLHPLYRRDFGTRFGDFAVAEAEYLRLVTLPLHTVLGRGDVDRVVSVVREETRAALR